MKVGPVEIPALARLAPMAGITNVRARDLIRTRLLLLLVPLSLLTGAVPAAAQLPSSTGWFQIPNSSIRPHCFPDVPGVIGCDGLTAAWNGGVFDRARNRLVLWGGGHRDYLGNEIYVIDLNTLTTSRLTDPGQPYAETSCVDALAGGTQPNSRHTYDGITFIDHTDEMFSVFGALAPCGGSPGGTWVFNFTSGSWTKLTPSGTAPGTAIHSNTATYDPVTGRVFVYAYEDGFLYRYDRTANSWTRLTSSFSPPRSGAKAVIDPKRRRLLIASGGEIKSYDIGAANPSARYPSLSGCSSIAKAGYGGLVYNSTIDRIVGWNGGDTITLLDLDTNACTTQSFAGGPSRLIKQWDNGIFGRWQYSVASNVFIYYGDVDRNAFVLRIQAGSAGPPPAR